MTDIKMKIEAPGFCIHCGFSPEMMKEKHGGIGWMMFAIPGTNVVFFQCSNCGNLQGNPAAVENTKKLMRIRAEEKAGRILSPGGSRIIVPGVNPN